MKLDPNHPRPTLQRPGWKSLEGPWNFSLNEAEDPKKVRFDRIIRVPFPSESQGSGVEVFLQEVLCYLEVACESLLSGFCYTQLYDTFQEENGLLDFWRRPKVPPERVRAFLEGCEARRVLWE